MKLKNISMKEYNMSGGNDNDIHTYWKIYAEISKEDESADSM